MTVLLSTYYSFTTLGVKAMNYWNNFLELYPDYPVNFTHFQFDAMLRRWSITEIVDSFSFSREAFNFAYF